MRKKFTLFTAVFLVLAFGVMYMKPLTAISESISEKVFRLHIIANSDSEKDQALKLQVRDGILTLTENLYRDCRSIDEAKAVTKENADRIQRTAQQIVRDSGYPYPVTVRTGHAYFDTRYYENYTLPAGYYDCLKIVIGEGRGHNWWCVIFPSVCLSACAGDFDGVLTPEEQQLIESGRYLPRFKLIEIYERLKNKKNRE